MDIIAGILAGIGGMAAVWAALRFAAPYIGKLAGSILKVRDDLDVDRDRIVQNLRAEIGDYQRRNTALAAELANVQAVNASLTERLTDCETFIRQYIGERRP